MDFRQGEADEGLCGSPQRDRKRMLTYLASQGISDERVLAAMGIVPRHQFIDDSQWDEAYANHPLPIERGQTISQPYIVAKMTECLELKATDRVLEIGTGSGYQAAVLAELASHVYTVERIEALSRHAAERLRSAGYQNITFCVGDGTLGWSEHTPYDAIIATGAAPELPSALTRQLAEGGRLVIPLGNRQIQKLMLIRKRDGELLKSEICYCSFVPLLGKEGWPVTERTIHG